MEDNINGMIIQQRLKNGILGGPYKVGFVANYNNVSFDISIEQFGIRNTTISANSQVELDVFIQLFNEIDMLIMLGEGKFIPIKEAKILNGDTVLDSAELSEKLSHRLNMFSSADYTQGSHSYFLTFDKYVNSERLTKWLSISDEMDILHKVVLYSMADTGLTIDCKCAFLIEAFKALTELIEIHVTNYARPFVKKGESKLGKYLVSVIDKYGGDIFTEELNVNKDAFIQILVNSRNRIAHIKSRQNKLYLTGTESVLYAVKLSFLYRIVILELLGIDYSLYADAVKQSVLGLNDWNGILTKFKKKL